MLSIIHLHVKHFTFICFTRKVPEETTFESFSTICFDEAEHFRVIFVGYTRNTEKQRLLDNTSESVHKSKLFGFVRNSASEIKR